MEKKLFHFQIAFKAVTPNAEGGVLIEGYASTPDVDRYNDIVQPEAFADALAMFMKNPALLRSHDPDCPAGTVTQAKVTDRGLWVQALVTEARTVDDIVNKRIAAFSIGYIPLESTLQHEDGSPFNAELDSPWDPKLIRVLTKLDLVEISCVTTPANGNALFTLAQSVKQFFSHLVTKSMKINPTENKDEQPEATPAAPATPPADEQEDKKTKKAGDPCTMDDGSDGTMEDDGNGTLVCTVKKAAPATEAKDEGKDEKPEPGAENDTPGQSGQEGAKQAQQEAENGGATPPTDGGETPDNGGEVPNAGAEAGQQPAAEGKDGGGVIGVDEATGKSLPQLVQAGIIEVREAGAISLPKQVVGLIAKLVSALEAKNLECNQLTEKLAKTPEKRSLKVNGQLGDAEATTDTGKKEASAEFMKMFQ
jgi:HK97 family phage prohead protease